MFENSNKYKASGYKNNCSVNETLKGIAFILAVYIYFSLNKTCPIPLILIFAVTSIFIAIISSVKFKKKINTDVLGYDYIYGIFNDDGIGKILIESLENGLNLYTDELNMVETIDYSSFIGIELHYESELKQPTTKRLLNDELYDVLFETLLNIKNENTESKDRYILELKFKTNNNFRHIFITANEDKLISLAYCIALQLYIKENSDNSSSN